FRDMLLAELQRREPGLMPELRRRAAGWCLRNGSPEEALEYSIAAGGVGGGGGVGAGGGGGGVRGGAGATARGGGGGVEGAGGRDRGTPDGRGAGLAPVGADGAAGRCRAVGRCGGSMAVRGRGAA